jgi:hypothetical protein
MTQNQEYFQHYYQKNKIDLIRKAKKRQKHNKTSYQAYQRNYRMKHKTELNKYNKKYCEKQKNEVILLGLVEIQTILGPINRKFQQIKNKLIQDILLWSEIN